MNPEPDFKPGCSITILLHGVEYSFDSTYPSKNHPTFLFDLGEKLQKMPEAARLAIYGKVCMGHFDAATKALQMLNNSVMHLFDSADGGFSPVGVSKYAGDPEFAKTAEAHRSRVTAIKGARHLGLASAEVQLVQLRKLRIHPLHERIHCKRDISDLVRGIALLGPIQSLIATTSYQVLSGGPCLLACLELGMELVPVRIAVLHEDEIDKFILFANRSPKRTDEELLREYGEYLRIYKELARKRQLAGIALPANLPEGPKGEASDLAAIEVGLCGTTAKRGYAVVIKLDEHERKGETTAVSTVRKALNKSIRAGYLAAARHSWVPPLGLSRRASGGCLRTVKASDNESSTQAEEKEKSETQKLIDAAVLKVSENGNRSSFHFTEVLDETGDKVTKAEIKRWIQINLDAGTLHEFSQGGLFLATRGNLLRKKEEIEEEIRTSQQCLLMVSTLLAKLGDTEWQPAP